MSELVNTLKEEGVSKNQPDKYFNKGQLAAGTAVETEHTDNLDAAKEIAKDHLAEDDKYYSKGNFPEEAAERINEMSGNKKKVTAEELRNTILSDRRMKIINGFFGIKKDKGGDK